MQICAGILEPTEGTVAVNGRVSALLELGSGFNPEFTGRDNVYLNGAILGLSRKEMDRRFPEIEAFAEIGDFIDRAVKTYSSGMIVRLAFAVAIHVDPEILLVDEALAVGDVYFRQRCMRKVHEMRAKALRFYSYPTPPVTLRPWETAPCGWKTDAIDGHWRNRSRCFKYLAAMAAKEACIGPRAPRRHAVAPKPRPRKSSRASPTSITVSGTDAPRSWGSRSSTPNGHVYLRCSRIQPSWSGSASAPKQSGSTHRRVHVPQPPWVDFAGPTQPVKADLPPLMIGETCTVDFYLDLPDLRFALFLLAGGGRRHPRTLLHLRLDR